nr:unnamed protein product [Digitaria exilis]
MASRLLTRSRALAHGLARADAAASAPIAGARSLRALSTLPQDPATAGSSPRQPSVRSPLDLPKEGASTKVKAFSPLEATIAKPRISPLRLESLKVKGNEIVTGSTYYMIPTILLISRNSVGTSLLVMSVFHQIYMFHKEILLDYVHNEVTRKWALIYFKVLLLIMVKDTIVYFSLV